MTQNPRLSSNPPRSPRGLALVLASAALSLAFSGCNEPKRPEGHYEGNLYQREGARVTQEPVSFDVSYDHDTGKIEIRDLAHAALATLRIGDLHKDRFSLEIPAIGSGPVELYRETDICFESRDGSDISLCFDANKISVEVYDTHHSPAYVLTGDHFAPVTPPTLEVPAEFTLAGAIERAMTTNFDSRIQYERMMEARHAANEAYLYLLPHITVSTILSHLSFSIMDLLGAVADLAPFLLPTNWAQASAAQSFAEAQERTLTVMRADLATQVEGLAYGLERDHALLAAYDSLIPRVKQALEQTQGLEAQGQMPDGSSDTISTELDSLQLDRIALESLIDADKSSLAQALGLYNPRGVSDLKIEAEINPIDHATAQDSEALGNAAVERSFELSQLGALMDSAHRSHLGLYFSWLNPSGSDTPLGFGIGEAIAVSDATIDELNARRSQIQQLVYQKARDAADSFNEALSAYPMATQNFALQERRLERVTAQIHPGSTLNTMDYEGVCQDYLASAIRLETIVASFRVARSKVDRLLLQGYYLRVPVPRLPNR